MIVPIVLGSMLAGGLYLRAKAKHAKRGHRAIVRRPEEPKLPGSGVTYPFASSTIAIERADTPGEPPFTWGVFNAAGLRAVARNPAGPFTGDDIEEAAAAGYELGLGQADTFEQACALAEGWAEQIAKPLHHDQVLALALSDAQGSKLIVVAPVSDGYDTRQAPSVYIGYVAELASWTNWSAGELPRPDQSLWQVRRPTAREALGQAILYATHHHDAATPIGVGQHHNAGYELQRDRGGRGLIAVGRRVRPGWHVRAGGPRRAVYSSMRRFNLPLRVLTTVSRQPPWIPPGYRAARPVPVALLAPGECGAYEGSGGSVWICCKRHDGNGYTCGQLRTPGGGWDPPSWNRRKPRLRVGRGPAMGGGMTSRGGPRRGPGAGETAVDAFGTLYTRSRGSRSL